MACSSSIMGRSGDKTTRDEALRNQRPQKINSRRIFIVAWYTQFWMNIQAPNSDAM